MIQRAILSATLTVPLMISALAAPSAYATGSSAQVCTDIGSVDYSISTSPTYLGDPDTRTYGQSGGTLSIDVSSSVTTTGTITGTTTAEAGAIFAKASASVGVSIELSKTSTVTRSYRWTVPSTQSVGWVEAGHHSYRISYNKHQIVAPCTDKVVKSNKVLGTTVNIEFKHS